MSQSWENPEQAYAWLLEHSRDTFCLYSSAALLHWDQRTYIPTKGHTHRSRQLATITKFTHERSVDPKRGQALDYLEQSQHYADSLCDEAVNIREWRREYDRSTKIPQELAVALAQTTSEAETAWEQARPKDDWDGFKPYLKKVLELRRQEAEHVGYEKEPYDALLDTYEPGETAAALEPVFAKLRDAIAALRARIQNAERTPDASILHQPYDVKAQRRFGMQVIEQFGYDFQAGRLDITAHPFSITMGPGDSRITTRYNADYFSEAFYGTAHEAGHALYEQGLPEKHWGTPRCEAVSLGIHESQSRLWENLVARSRGFWKHFYPKAQETFPALEKIALDDFLFAVNQVTPGLIRIEADEVTYNLHVLLRFELELALVRGDLAVDDLPAAWDEKMQQYLGLTPPNKADGVMQDVHWSAGLLGYFPTYTLGNLYAAQFFHSAEQHLGTQEDAFAKGNFAPLLAWLRTHIHEQGMRHRPRDLVRVVTGEDMNPDYLIRYLDTKFGAYYGV